jgi:hypothetical protein
VAKINLFLAKIEQSTLLRETITAGCREPTENAVCTVTENSQPTTNAKANRIK